MRDKQQIISILGKILIESKQLFVDNCRFATPFLMWQIMVTLYEGSAKMKENNDFDIYFSRPLYALCF